MGMKIKDLREKLRDWLREGVVNDAALAVLRARQSRQAKRSHRNHVAGKKADRKSRAERAQGHAVRADYQAAKAARCHHRAYISHLRAQELIRRIKARVRHDKLIQAAMKHLKGDIAKWERANGPSVASNTPDKVAGGTARQRLVWAANKAITNNSFYSQPGGWTVNYVWNRVPHEYRSDCSQFVTSVCHAAGIPDPNGENYGGGYTGTLAGHLRKISRSELKPGDLVLYGSFPYHHVEMYVGPGDLTIGHGSAPIDHGSIYMLGSAVAFYRVEA